MNAALSQSPLPPLLVSAFTVGAAPAAVVARAGIFQSVEPAAVAALTTQLQPVHFACRQTAYAEGDPGDRLYIITSGKVKIGRRCSDGRSHLLTIVGPSDVLITDSERLVRRARLTTMSDLVDNQPINGSSLLARAIGVSDAYPVRRPNTKEQERAHRDYRSRRSRACAAVDRGRASCPTHHHLR
jgi:hypothetical protein